MRPILFVIMDKFSPPLYFVRDIEWSYKVTEAMQFPSVSQAETVRASLPYTESTIAPYLPVFHG